MLIRPCVLKSREVPQMHNDNHRDADGFEPFSESLGVVITALAFCHVKRHGGPTAGYGAGRWCFRYF